jgi:hypothetical protein
MKAFIAYIKYLAYILMGISALVGLLFYMNVISEGLLLTWAYILVITAAVTSLLFPLLNFVTNPKKGLGTLVGVLVLGVIILISYMLGSGEVLNIMGYTGTDNVPSTLKLTDMGIFTMYFLLFGAFFAIVVTEVMSFFK